MTVSQPYASDPLATKGRLHQADASNTRSPFQRDRDRIIHSAAFRRLQHKTQVFLHHEGHHFRTRLTHTLEVSQIARSIARALQLNEDLAEAVSLAHDLGHPPFGHAGERVLNEKMANFGGFDHNMQAIRVVTMLENRYAAHDGLNLTWECLEGILKHNGPLCDRSGALLGEYAETGLPFGAHDIPAVAPIPLQGFASLEAQAAAIADDIAYNSHDIDDAVRAGLITLDDLKTLPFVGDAVRDIEQQWPDLETRRIIHEVQRRMITGLIEDVIETSSARLEKILPTTPQDVRNAGMALIGPSTRLASDLAEIKKFMFINVYRAESVMQPVRAGQRLVARLFDQLLDNDGLPARWALAAENAPDQTARARIVCDFIAGMTDPFAIDLYGSLFDEGIEFS